MASLSTSASATLTRLAGSLLILCEATSPLPGEEPPPEAILRSVTFQGRRRIPHSALLSVTGLRPGEPLPEGADRKAFRRLLE